MSSKSPGSSPLRLAFSLAALAALTTSCVQSTNFTGSAHVLEGRQGCEAKCRGQGMELVGMVYMGEYSDACVCAVPGESAAAASDVRLASAGIAAGAAGVVMQMRRQEEERRRQQQTYRY